MMTCDVCGSDGTRCHWASYPAEVATAERLIAQGAGAQEYACRNDGTCTGHRQVRCPACGDAYTLIDGCPAQWAASVPAD